MLVLSKYKDMQTCRQTASIVQKDLQRTAQPFSWCVYSQFMFTPFQEYSLHTQACCRGAAGRGGPGQGSSACLVHTQLCSSLAGPVNFLQGASGRGQQDHQSAKVAGTQYPYRSATQPPSGRSRSVPWDMELSGLKKIYFKDYYSDIIHIT